MKNDSIKLDFCPHCRRRIDWAIDAFPWKEIYIKANPEGAEPATRHKTIVLCETCGTFVSSALKVDGFTIHTP